MQIISVVVIEGRRLSRDGIVALLREQPGIQVVGAAETADLALPILRSALPQVVLMAAEQGSDEDARAVARVRAAGPEAQLVLTNLEPAPTKLIWFIKAGVRGFVLRTATLAEVVDAVRRVAAGGNVLPSALATDLFARLAAVGRLPYRSRPNRAVQLTRREREVIRLIAEGASNKEIAQRLHLATNTVKTHVQNILEKLALHTRLQLAAFAHGVTRREAAEAPAAEPAITTSV